MASSFSQCGSAGVSVQEPIKIEEQMVPKYIYFNPNQSAMLEMLYQENPRQDEYKLSELTRCLDIKLEYASYWFDARSREISTVSVAELGQILSSEPSSSTNTSSPVACSPLPPPSQQQQQRTLFTTKQKDILEATFMKSPYLSRQIRRDLAVDFKCRGEKIKIWFKNRRAKAKRTAGSRQSTVSTPPISPPTSVNATPTALIVPESSGKHDYLDIPLLE